MCCYAMRVLSSALRLVLEWTAPAGCPDEAQMLEQIERRIGTVDTDVRAEGVVESVDGGFVVHLEIDASQRSLRGATCREVSDAAGLIIAMAIDPELAGAPTPPDAPPAEQDELVPSPEETVIRPSDGVAAVVRPSPPRPPRSDAVVYESAEPEPEARPRPANLHFIARAMAGLGLGPLPGPAATLVGAAGVGGTLWRVEVAGSFWPAVVGRDAGRTVSARLWSVGPRGCVVPRHREVTFEVCTGVDAGLMHAVGGGGVEPIEARTPWAAAVLGAGATWWPIRALGLGARAVGHATLYRPVFHTEPSGEIHRAGAVGVQLLGGILVRIP